MSQFTLETRLALRLTDSYPNRTRIADLKKATGVETDEVTNALTRLKKAGVVEWQPTGYAITTEGLVCLVKILKAAT